MKKKINNIENFIGIYDNYILPEECDKAIKLFDDQHKFKNTLNRQAFESAPTLNKKDNQERAEMTDANVGHEAFDKSTSDLPLGHPDHPNKKFQMTPGDDIDMLYKEGDFNVTPKKPGLLSYENVKSKHINYAKKLIKITKIINYAKLHN